MDRQVHRNLVKKIPYDSIQPDIQAIMNEFDYDDMRERSNVDKLKRGVIES
jgi:hypothetical protein